jgi:D-3-phosphoglycerate dehydrogenase
MRLLAYDPYVGAERARRLGVDLVDSLDRLFHESDFITVHLPLTRDTEGLLGADAFARMKTGVRIVNASRGGIVDEAALVAAIRSGRVAGAALDVFASEPLTASPLFGLAEVVVTPHLGASTTEAQDKAGIDVAESVAAALRGELVLSAVNVDLGREVDDEVRAYLPVAERLGRVFVGLALGVPSRITVRVQGRLGAFPVRPLVIAALKGAFSRVTSAPVSYVNALGLAEERGVSVEQESSEEAAEYVSLLRLSGIVGGRRVSVAGTLGRKGPLLVDLLGCEVELPIADNMLLVRNADIPGMIGRVGVFLGDNGINIANMAVGRSPIGEAAMMGLHLDQPLGEPLLAGLRALPGVHEAVFVDLSGQ